MGEGRGYVGEMKSEGRDERRRGERRRGEGGWVREGSEG